MIVQQWTSLTFQVKLTLDEIDEVRRYTAFGHLSEAECLKCIIEDGLNGSKDTDPER